MNKRELIKALFKDPTIKALYESGQFNAADINRAILTEASSEKDNARLVDNFLIKVSRVNLQKVDEYTKYISAALQSNDRVKQKFLKNVKSGNDQWAMTVGRMMEHFLFIAGMNELGNHTVKGYKPAELTYSLTNFKFPSAQAKQVESALSLETDFLKEKFNNLGKSAIGGYKFPSDELNNFLGGLPNTSSTEKVLSYVANAVVKGFKKNLVDQIKEKLSGSKQNTTDNSAGTQDAEAEIEKLKQTSKKLTAQAAKVRSEKGGEAAKGIVLKRNKVNNRVKELEAEIGTDGKPAQSEEPQHLAQLKKDFETKKAEFIELSKQVEETKDQKLIEKIQELYEKFEDVAAVVKDAIENNYGEDDPAVQELEMYTLPELDQQITALRTTMRSFDRTKKTEPQLPAGKGWGNAQESIRGFIQRNNPSLQDLIEATESVDAFKAMFKLARKIDPETAMGQLEAELDKKWLADTLKKAQQKIKNEQDQKKAAEELARIAATQQSYSEFLELKAEQGQQIQIPPGFTFPTGPVPTSEKEFEQQFIAPLEKEQGTEAVEQDYVTLGKQIVSQNPNIFKDIEINDDITRFIGYFVAEYSKALASELNEDLSGIANISDSYRKVIEKYDQFEKVKDTIGRNYGTWNEIFDEIQDLIRQGKIPDTGTTLSTKEPEARENKLLVVQQQQDEALKQKADPKADEDLSVLEQEEMDSAWKEQLDTFFGKNPGSSSFMRRLLLRDQAAMLYSMIATLDKIILGKRKKGDELEQGSLSDQYDENPEKPAEQSVQKEEQVINEIFGMFTGKKEKNEKVQLSKESTRNMRQDLEGMVGLLRSLKTDIGDYSKYSTSSSVDPRFDGSTLKKAMDAKLIVVQERIAMLTEQIKTSVIEQDKQVAADAAAVGKELEEVLQMLNEADESERRMKIKKVREVYDEMRRLYIDGLMRSLETNDIMNSKAGAKQIKEYIMNEKEFLGFFPSNIVTGGTVMTLGDAYKSMSAIIGKFIDTIRDIVTITKTQTVSKESLEQAAGNLVSIAENIEDMFKVPSKIDGDFVKKYKQAAASNPDSGSITNEKPEAEDDTFGLVKKWFSDNASAVMDKISEKLLKALANGFKGKAVNEELLDDVAGSIEWYSSLSNDQKNALEVYSKNILNSIRKPSLKENLKTKLVDGLESAGLDKKYAKRVYPAFIGLPVNDKDIITKLMEQNMESVVKYIYTFLSLYGDFGQETAEAMIDSESDPSSSEAGDTVDPSASEEGETTYPDPEGIKKQLGADLNEDDPVILDYMQSLLEAISEIIRESSSTTVAENVFSGVKKFAKGMKRSLTTDASEATEQIVDSMQFKNKEAAKELIEQSLSSNTSKILRKYNFKDLAEKTDKFFNHFKDLINYVNEPTAEFRADAASIASELTRNIDADIEAIGGPLSPKEGGEDKRNPIKKEELKSILAKYKKEYLKGKTPSAPRTNVALMHALAGLYGETLANFLIDKVAPRLTSEGVKDSRAKQKKGERLRKEIKQILKNPVEGSELHKLIGTSAASKERTQYVNTVSSMLIALAELPRFSTDDVLQEYDRIKSGKKPSKKTGPGVRKQYEEAEKIYPGGLKRLHREVGKQKMHNFMAKFGNAVFKNPDIIPDDEQNLADNIVGYYREYLKNEDNNLSPSEIMDLRLITIEGPVETVEEALKPIIETMLKEHYNY